MSKKFRPPCVFQLSMLAVVLLLASACSTVKTAFPNDHELQKNRETALAAAVEAEHDEDEAPIHIEHVAEKASLLSRDAKAHVTVDGQPTYIEASVFSLRWPAAVALSLVGLPFLPVTVVAGIIIGSFTLATGPIGLLGIFVCTIGGFIAPFLPALVAYRWLETTEQAEVFESLVDEATERDVDRGAVDGSPIWSTMSELDDAEQRAAPPDDNEFLEVD